MASIANKIKANKETLEETSSQLSALSEEISELNVSIKDQNNKVKELEKELADSQQQLQQSRIEVQARNNRKHNLQRQAEELEKLIRDDTREQAILALLSEQKDFWELAEDRLTLLMDGLNNGLAGFEDNVKKPADIITFLRKEKENNRAFNRRSATTHEAMTHYTNCLRRLCEMRIDKQQIPPTEKQARLDVIDRYFHNVEIVGLWS